jgi:hypothetical protein
MLALPARKPIQRTSKSNSSPTKNGKAAGRDSDFKEATVWGEGESVAKAVTEVRERRNIRI